VLFLSTRDLLYLLRVQLNLKRHQIFVKNVLQFLSTLVRPQGIVMCKSTVFHVIAKKYQYRPQLIHLLRHKLCHLESMVCEPQIPLDGFQLNLRKGSYSKRCMQCFDPSLTEPDIILVAYKCSLRGSGLIQRCK
jgi:hypothetical protein